MERWNGKIAIVTGASSGIGARIATALVRAGLVVVGLARRVDKIKELAGTLGKDKSKLHALACDVTKEEDILKAFRWVEKEFGGVDVLINNAGVVFTEPIIEGKTEHYHQVMNVNVIAMAICTREAVQSIKKRNAFGHIININSYAGHYAESIKYPVGLYTASKYAVTGMSHSVRHEITAAKLNIKVTSLSPGVVHTEMVSKVMPDLQPDKYAMMKDSDAADMVMFALSTPPHVQIYELVFSPLELGGELNLIDEVLKPSDTGISK